MTWAPDLQPATLRNGFYAEIRAAQPADAPWALSGYIIDETRRTSIDLWTKGGFWREDQQKHPLDIVYAIDPEAKLFACLPEASKV